MTNEHITTNKKTFQQVKHTVINIYKDITIKRHKFKALLDTGSDLCLLAKSVFDQLPHEILFPCDIEILGVGEGKLKVLGYIIAKVQIDNVTFNWTFYVVEDKDINVQCLIGSDILEILDIFFTKNDATILLKKEQEDIIELLFQESLGYKNTYNEKFTAGVVFNAICTDNEIVMDKMADLGIMTKGTKIKLLTLINTYEPKKKNETKVEMKILLTDEKPIRERPRRLPYAEQKIVEKQIDEWINDGIIQQSHSEFAAPIVLVPKKDGSKRICVDYRKINQQVIKDNFPMVLIDDVVSKLANAKFFSTIDLKNGFFHVPVHKDSCKYTSFVTHHGQYEFKKVPFGMKNSPAIFCRFIADIFHDLIRKGVLIIYMDDIVIPSQTENENLQKLEQVLQTASDHGLHINWKKCQFIKTEINFLGYNIENGSIKPSEIKIKAIKNYKIPKDIKSIQRFLGLVSYFRRFISDFAIKARPLTNMLTKGAIFKFEDDEKIAFEELRQALITAPILKIFNIDKETEIHTDASIYGYGAVLLQKDAEDQQFHPVEYMSRKTSATEQKYHSYELEVLAIVEALKKWRVYLLGIPFKIVTDCNAFTQTVNKKDIPAKIARWVMFMQDFHYKIEHRPASRLRHVDALSRVHTLMIQSSLKHSIIEAQKRDDYIAVIRDLVNKTGHKDFYIKSDVLFKDPTKELIVIPQAMEKDIIELTHKQGHYATKKTTELIEKNYYIKDLTKKTDEYIKTCIQCIQANAKTGKKEGLLNPIDKSDRPLQTLHIDHLGPLQTTKKQYNHILTIVDAFSKFTWIFPTKTTTAEETVSKIEKITAIFGNPERIITDRGTAFTSQTFQNFCKSNNITHHTITTGVPRGNGQVERMHRTIISILTKLCLEDNQNWYKHTDKVQQFINNTPARSTKIPPFKILTGLGMNLPQDNKIKDLIEEEILLELDKEREDIRLLARDNIHKIQKENKNHYDKKRKQETPYEIDELVAIKRTQFGTGLKLKPKFLGPYKVTAQKTLGRYEVEKVGQCEGPNRTTTTAEYMKKW